MPGVGTAFWVRSAESTDEEQRITSRSRAAPPSAARTRCRAAQARHEAPVGCRARTWRASLLPCRC